MRKCQAIAIQSLRPMAKLKNPSQPPALFYTVILGGRMKRIPKTGHYASLDKLVEEVRGFYQLNADPIPDDLAQLVEDQVCHRYKDKCWNVKADLSVPQVKEGKKDKGIVTRVSQLTHAASSLTGFSSEELLLGSKALWQNATGETVDQPAVEARASVCRSGNAGHNCPYLRPTSEVQRAQESCQSCGGKARLQNAGQTAKKAAKATLAFLGIKPAYTLPTDLEGLGCAVCGCFMDDLLSATPELLSQKQDTPQQDTKRPAYCWARPLIQRPSAEIPTNEPV